MATLKIEGIAKLNKGLKKRMEYERCADSCTEKRGRYAKESAEECSSRYRDTERSIGIDISDGGMTATVEPTAEYAPYVELGTRFMEAQPYLKPAFEEQKKQFEKDLQKLVR